jgi:hypothetical protein
VVSNLHCEAETMTTTHLRQALITTLTATALSACGAQDADDDAAALEPVIATYRDQTLDLSDSWSDAQICVEVAADDVRCYGNEEEYRADALSYDPAAGDRAYGDCPSGYVCLWDGINYSGRRLQWNLKGTKYLGDWGFRDKASSARSRRHGDAHLSDVRTLLPDPKLYIPSGWGLPKLSKYQFDNKADKLILPP